jgi:hypothetical protein
VGGTRHFHHPDASQVVTVSFEYAWCAWPFPQSSLTTGRVSDNQPEDKSEGDWEAWGVSRGAKGPERTLSGERKHRGYLVPESREGHASVQDHPAGLAWTRVACVVPSCACFLFMAKQWLDGCEDPVKQHGRLFKPSPRM